MGWLTKRRANQPAEHAALAESACHASTQRLAFGAACQAIEQPR
jgi:hypothetical protein